MTNNKNLKDIAYRSIKEKIIECEYAPGMMLNEIQLCKELEISRTPVRESISRLESENFVKILPKKGIYVTDISMSDVIQIFQTRIEIEPITLRLAAPRLPKEELLSFRDKFKASEPDGKNSFRLDVAMHLFLLENCGNRYLIDMMHRVLAENTRIIISNKLYEVTTHDARKEHLEILELLIDGKYYEAVEAIRSHVKACRQSTLDHYYENQNLAYTPEPTYKAMLDKNE